MDKRFVSLSSLSTNVSDLSIRDPRVPSPSQSRSSSEKSDHNNARRSNPDLQASSPSHHSQAYQNHQNGPPTTQSTFINPTHLSTMIEDGDGMLQPPALHRPQPQGLDSPNGSRPSSRMGRPESKSGIESRGNSRPGSRQGSPSKLRPPTPGLDSKIKKRRSWIPGKSSTETTEGKKGGEGTQAWVVTSHEKENYDMGPLVHFQQVCMTRFQEINWHADQVPGTRALGRQWRHTGLSAQQTLRPWSILPSRLFMLCII